MAAQARHYEKGITYSARQVDDKYISKNRHNSHLKSSRESSPYRSGKASSRSSPAERKRPYNSPNSSKLSNSPYESNRKKDRVDMGKFECDHYIDDTDWSQHVSSLGKVYYYNKRTEESQWEVPKGWINREQGMNEPGQKDRSARGSLNFSKDSIRDDFHNCRDSRDIKDYKYKDKTNFKDYRAHDSRQSYRGKNRDKDCREFWENYKDHDYRDRDSRDYNDGKHRVNSGSSKRGENKYSSPSIRTVGQTTPSSSTSHSRSHRRPTPDSLNGSSSGSVQDISPPGTPTNDDIVNISTISPAPLYTPHGCSPLISTSMTKNSLLPLPTTPHTPLLSPVLMNSTPHISTTYLHPLQQALLLQQQQAASKKDVYRSPKLPTVKNHLVDKGGTTPTSMISNHKASDLHSPDILNRNSTPPPPPPPLKDNNRIQSSKERNSKHDREHLQTPTQELRSDQQNSRDELNRTKPHEVQHGDTPIKTGCKPNELRFNSERLIKKTIRLVPEEHAPFPELPDLEKYAQYFSPSAADFNSNFYCNNLEKQISTSWEETMNFLHTEGYRSKFNLSISRQDCDSQEAKLDVSSGWVDALNNVISKVESLQDSSMKSDGRSTREVKTLTPSRKHKAETNDNDLKENGEKNNIKETDSKSPLIEKAVVVNNCQENHSKLHR